MIQEWITENHGGMEWSWIQNEKLMSEEARVGYATEIVSGLVDTWSQTVSGMPPVCDNGVFCRE